jgi:hypothetical protein
MNVLKIHNFVQFDHHHYNHISQKNDHQYQNVYHIRIEHYEFLDVPDQF